ncbi:MAG TPA: hypothetical protein VMI31_07935 [Fimbriimonadaceae bacterium]|nr:hypothetical protein [Fimbriimonadaceae bacterium]
MTFLALAFGLAQASNPTVLPSRVVSAAVFKPGVVMLVREVEVPAGSGSYALDTLPNAIDGSFWFGSPDGAQISDMDTTIRLEEDSKTYEAKTLPEMLYANVAKHMTLKVSGYRAGELETLSGTLTNLDDRSQSLTLKLDSGDFRQVAISQVVELNPEGLETKYTRRGKVPTLHVQFKADAAKAAHVEFTDLEPGAAWNASYLVDLGSSGAATIEGKAQLALGGLKFDKTDVKLMAGYPNLPSGGKMDLASGAGSLTSYLQGGGQDGFSAYRPGIADPYDLFAAWIQQMQLALDRYSIGMYNNYSGGYGGFAPADSIGVDYTYRNGLFRGETPAGTKTMEALPSDASIFRSESLYAYPIGPTTLEPGDRLTKLLFAQPSHYKTVYRWDAADANTPVQEFLRVHNDAKNPWTGGVATVTKEGIPLAQTDMPFTAVGHDADLGLGTAPDILTDKGVEETKAEEIPNPNRKQGENLKVRLTELTRMSATNTKDEPVTLEIVLTLPGEVTAEGAKMEKLPRRFGDLNAQVRITWTLQLAPGEQKKISVTNTYVR